MSRKKHKKNKKKDPNYLIPDIDFPVEEEEEYEDPLLYVMDKRVNMVMEVLQTMKENGADFTNLYGLYESELHMMLALGNLHEQLIQYENFDGEDDDDEDDE